MDEPFEAEVMALTRETIARCARLLDLTDVTVVLLPESPENAFVLERMGGVAGLTVGAGWWCCGSRRPPRGSRSWWTR
ncbi:hypothetical protein ACFSC4_09950 [Deinococcus malanensis]|uniref:hypothetical protein n=1 Tax=Deinococcus malanensis TaxID=1706855 RepID=UPI00362FFA17